MHAGLGDRRVGHKRVLQLDRGDPLPALYEVFAAVGDLDKPETVYGDDVPRLEPTVVRKLVVALRRLVVRTRDPGTADFQLAHGLPSHGTKPSSPRARISTKGTG